jgi:hypothetical protein
MDGLGQGEREGYRWVMLPQDRIVLMLRVIRYYESERDDVVLVEIYG